MIQNDLSRRAVIGRKQNRGFSPTAEGSFRIENMRILADGAAAVREGFAYRCTLPAAPRAMLGADEKRFYVIAGSGFYLTDTETGESTLISEVNTSAGGAAIFRYGGRGYVLDGDDMWLYGDGGLWVRPLEMFLSEVFKKGSIDSLDQETLFTIQKFFENNLNVSETSRKLFVHRNTLVYRLEKIKKLTGLDLREFDHAIVFKVALMVRKYLASREEGVR